MIDIYMKNTKKRAPSDRHSSRYYIFFSFSKVSFPEKLPPDGVQTCWFWAAGEWLSFHLIDRFLRQFRYFFY